MHSHIFMDICFFIFYFPSFLKHATKNSPPLLRSFQNKYELNTPTLNLSGGISLCLRIMVEMCKMNSPKCKSERVGSFLPGVIILLLKISRATAEIICKYPPHGALTGWHIISRETAVAILGFWVWSNQKTEARLKRCVAKHARQREHFKQDASPVGDWMLRPPVETGAPGNLHRARRDKTDSLKSQTMKNESM